MHPAYGHFSTSLDVSRAASDPGQPAAKIGAGGNGPNTHGLFGQEVPAPPWEGALREMLRDPLVRIVAALGVLLRIVLACSSHGFVHPDEHQQYIEAAQGLAHGYQVNFWEQTAGARHPLDATLLGAAIRVLDAVGIENPLAQIEVIRAGLSLSVFAASLLFVGLWWPERRSLVRAAVVLLALVPEFLFYGVRTLSETAALIPIFLAWFLAARGRLLAAGICCGILFAVRFHTAFLSIGLVLLALFRDCREWRGPGKAGRSATVPLVSGLALSLLLVGSWDRLVWGQWFHSSLTYFHRNVTEGWAAAHGVSPWHEYLTLVAQRLAEFGPAALPLLALGVWQMPRLQFPSLVYLAAHSAVGHKEFRFLIPLLPFAFLALAAGWSAVWDRACSLRQRRACGWVTAGSLLLGLVLQTTRIDWALEPARSVACALAACGTRSDVRGVVVCGVPEWWCGNYFYLRRNVPLISLDRGCEDQSLQAVQKSGANYVVADASDIGRLERWHPRLVSSFARLHLWQLGRPDEEPSAAALLPARGVASSESSPLHSRRSSLDP